MVGDCRPPQDLCLHHELMVRSAQRSRLLENRIASGTCGSGQLTSPSLPRCAPVSPLPVLRRRRYLFGHTGCLWEVDRGVSAPSDPNNRPHPAVSGSSGRLLLGTGHWTVLEPCGRHAPVAGCRTDCGRKPVVDTPTPSQRVRRLQVSAGHRPVRG